MATIYDEIKEQFNKKLDEENHKSELKKKEISSKVLNLGVSILIEQIKKLRKNNFMETTVQISSDANEILKTLDSAINETK